MSKIDTLRHLAEQIENQPQAREQIAAGFRLMAGFFEHMLTLLAGSATPEDALRVLEESAHQLRESIASCTDCTSQQGQALAPTFCQKCLTHSDSLHRERYCTCGDPINGPKQGQALDPADNSEAGADTAPAGVDLVDTAGQVEG